MQYAQEADLGAEMFGIGGDLQQSGSRGAEQKIVDELLVLETQTGELLGKGEDHMKVAHGG